VALVLRIGDGGEVVGIAPLLVQENIPLGTKRDYRKIATDVLQQHFGEGLDSEEMDELAHSVAKQWQQYEGHACLFIDGRQQFHFKLNEYSDGTGEVLARSMSVDLGTLLSSHGFLPEVLPELIARINLNQEIEFRDKHGAPSVLWHDPKARRTCVRKVAPAQPTVPVKTPPDLCPKCTAVLRLWQEGERQQTCPLCGQTI
jgi:hypothetical protein